MELFKGINQIKVPLDEKDSNAVNVYIIEGTSGNLMIDTGFNIPACFNILSQEMKASGFSIKDITHIAITHIHPDHIGMAGKIAELSGAKIYVSEIEYAQLDTRYWHPESLIKQTSDFLRLNGVPDWELKMLSEASLSLVNNVYPISSVEYLKPLDRIIVEPFEFQLLLTPGHSKGHICFYEPNKKYLFSGDHVLPEIMTTVCYHPQSGENPLADYINSLNELTNMEIRFIFPGHGAVFSGIAPKIDSIMHWLKEQMQSIQKVMGLEIKTAYDVAKNLLWFANDELVDYDKLQAIRRRQAVLQTLAFLQYLVTDNKCKKLHHEDTITYWFDA